MAPPLTERESLILRYYGQLSIVHFVSLMAEMMCWGIYIPVIILSSFLLCRQGVKKSRPRLVLLVITIYMFVSSTAILGLTVYSYVGQVKALSFVDTLEGETFNDKAEKALPSTDRALFSSAVLFCFELLLGDAIVVWRAYVLWQDRRRLTLLPMALWVGALGTFFGWVVCELLDFDAIPAGYPEKPAYKFQLSQGILSVAANATSTVLILYRAWQFRRSIMKTTGLGEATKSQKVLSLLVESGIVFILAAVAKMLVFTNPVYGPGMVLIAVFDYSANQLIVPLSLALGDQCRSHSSFQGLYPTVIIILVQLQRTVWDLPDVSEVVVSTLQAADPESASTQERSGLSSGPMPATQLMVAGANNSWRHDKSLPLVPLQEGR